MQTLITLVMLAGFGLFLLLIAITTVGMVVDIFTSGEDKQRALRKELWRMDGDPKDKP